MDLTVLATPFYFATMAIERAVLRKRRANPDFDAGQYEPRDTAANLTMAVGSVLVPFANMKIRRHLEIGRGTAAKPVAALAGAALATSLVSDVIARQKRRRNKPAENLERVAGIAALTAIASGGILITTSTASKLAATRLWNRRICDLGSGATGWIAALIGWDFIYYWNHRFMHESRFLWAVHVPHHSSERYNLSVALRQPVTDVAGLFVPYGLMSLVGIRPSMIETSRALNLLYQYWVHTETIPKLGPIEAQMNTASHHRVHHGSNPQYLDRNHGGIFISWDKAFGTFEPEGDKVAYGLTKNLNSHSPLTIAGREYADMARDVIGSTTWRDRLSFVLRGPGWAYERRRTLDAAQV